MPRGGLSSRMRPGVSIPRRGPCLWMANSELELVGLVVITARSMPRRRTMARSSGSSQLLETLATRRAAQIAGLESVEGVQLTQSRRRGSLHVRSQPTCFMTSMAICSRFLCLQRHSPWPTARVESLRRVSHRRSRAPTLLLRCDLSRSQVRSAFLVIDRAPLQYCRGIVAFKGV